MAKAGIVYVGTDDGVVILSDPASIGRWRRIGHELAGESVRAIVAHSALVIDLAVAGLGVQHSDDGGQSWRQTSEEDVVALASHVSTAATVLLATSAGEIQRSDDGGITWHPLPPGDRPAGDIARMLIDPQASERVLVALRGGNVWASDDDQNWSTFGVGVPVDLDGLVASPGRSGTLFATSGDSLWSVSAPDAQWTETAGALPAPLSGALAILAGKTEVLLATASDPQGTHSLLRSDNDGASWQIASAQPELESPVTIIAPATYHPDTAWRAQAAVNYFFPTTEAAPGSLLRATLPRYAPWPLFAWRESLSEGYGTVRPREVSFHGSLYAIDRVFNKTCGSVENAFREPIA